MKLERIEWTNTWREDATEDTPRVLLIGDSITQGYRSVVNRLFEGRARVTAFATSKAIDNEFLLEEIALLCKQEGNDYVAVHFNNGLHGGGLTVEEYEANYRRVLKALRALLPGIPVVLALSTPVTANGDTARYPERNDHVIACNEAVCRIAEEEGLPVNDLYSVVYGKADVRTQDGYHYLAPGYELLAAEVVKALDAVIEK